MRFLDQQTLLQVALMHSDKCVNDIEAVTEIVEHHPGDGEHVVQLPEHGSPHHQDQIVQHRNVYYP